MSNRSGYKRGRRGDAKHFDKSAASKQDVQVDESSEVIKSFRKYQGELDAKHDRHERIVKYSRDITIESKRAIFLLHRIVGSKDKEAIMKEAVAKLDEIVKTKWNGIAKELHGQDPYQYIRAFSAGLQEYIEALSFYNYLKNDKLISLSEVESKLYFTKSDETESSSQLKTKENTITETETETKIENSQLTEKIEAENTDKENQEINETCNVPIPPMEFMLGLADLTGELMRLAINSVGGGDLELPFQLCSFLRKFYDAFISYGNCNKEFSRKIWTLKQSTQKVENVCYTLQVRGSEVPKHMLVDVISAPNTGMYTEEDE